MISVNLIPPARRRAKRQQLRLKRWTVICALYAGIVAGLCLLVCLLWPREHTNVRAQLAGESVRVEQAQEDVRRLQAQLAEVQQELAANQAVGQHPDWSVLLSLVGSSADAQLVLQRMQLRRMGADDGPLGRQRSASNGPPAEGYNLTLQGAGVTQGAVSQFVLALERAKLFDQVRLLGTRREKILQTPAVVFEVHCSMQARAEGTR